MPTGRVLLAVGERGADLLLGQLGEALVELGQLACEIVVAARGCQEGDLRYAVAAAGSLR